MGFASVAQRGYTLAMSLLVLVTLLDYVVAGQDFGHVSMMDFALYCLNLYFMLDTTG